MLNNRRFSPAAQRFAERRRRENDAPRLSDEVPELKSLRLEIEEQAAGAASQPKHIRRVVVDNAPALFLVPCGDPRCTDGEHDVTRVVMQALRARETKFTGSDECRGSVGTSACPRVLHFEAIAEYGDARPATR